MTFEELYYRRSYNLLNKLIDTYKNGFDKQKTYCLWEEEYLKSKYNYALVKSARDSLMLTISIALMGLNKEKLEDSKKIENYENDLILLDVKDFNLKKEERDFLLNFEKIKIRNTPFDKWLSLINSPDSDKSSIDILKRVRNGLLHSNFNIDTSNPLFTTTHIKTKSYYESCILNDNFNQFILAYFSNHAEIGITEKTVTYTINRDIKITDDESLKRFLRNIIILYYKHKNPTYNGNNTLDYIMHVTADKNVINLDKIEQEIEKHNIEIENIIPFSLKEQGIENIINNLKSMNHNLYSLTSEQIKSLSITHIDYQLTPIKEISNLLLHYYYLILYLINNSFDINTPFFQGDEYARDAFMPSLMILKSYLILYRLQNNTFDEINYNDINFEFEDINYTTYSKNLNDPNDNTDYIEESYYKIHDNNPSLDDYTIFKKIYIEIIRNALAHGNIIPRISANCISTIEFKDEYKGKIRSIIIDTEKLEILLNSKAFEPKYCFNKEDEKTLKK